jgi:hypothetical protein
VPKGMLVFFRIRVIGIAEIIVTSSLFFANGKSQTICIGGSIIARTFGTKVVVDILGRKDNPIRTL